MLSRKIQTCGLEVSTFRHPHYKIVNPASVPLLYTTSISDCLGIGLVYKSNGQVRKIGLYHSYSEHGVGKTDLSDDYMRKCITGTDNHFLAKNETSGSYLIPAIHEFILDINNTSDVHIYLHVNKTMSFLSEENKLTDSHYANMKKILDRICEYQEKLSIPTANLHILRGDECFVLSSSGVTNLHLNEDHFVSHNELARQVVIFIQDVLYKSLEENRGFIKHEIQFPQGVRHGNETDNSIIKMISSVKDSNWIDVCQKIMDKLKHVEYSLTNKCRETFYSGDKKEAMNLAYSEIKYVLEFLEYRGTFTYLKSPRP